MNITPQQFFGDSPPPRIIGTETEYGATEHIEQADLNAAIAKTGEHSLRRLGALGFMSNGSRVYRDYAKFTEYATPECLGPSEACFYEQGAHEYAQELGQAFEEPGPLTTMNVTAYFNTHTLDNKPELKTTGYHENYLAPRSVKGAFVLPLASLLATRNVLFGAGLVLPNGEYSCGGKAGSVAEVVGENRTGDSKKPMIYSPAKIDSHADTQRWQRIEVRCGDATLSPWATFMRLAISSVALRLVEHKAFPQELVLKNPLQAFHEVSESPDGRIPVESKGFGKLFAHEWLGILGETALDLGGKVGLPTDESVAITELLTAVDDYDSDINLLLDRVEHITKRQALERLDAKSKLAERLALQARWGLLDTSKGRCLRLVKSSFFRPAPFVQEDNKDHTEPPKTRARLRVHLHKKIKSAVNYSTPMDWAKVGDIRLLNPYQHTR